MSTKSWPVHSKTELKDPTINLNALYDARFDPVIGQYLASIGARNREPSDLNRELFGYGQLAGYSYADGQRSAWGDIKLIANSMVSLGQSVLYSGTSDQIGPYDELKLKANYQLLLKDQGRWAEAGFVEGAEWATTQRLMWSGIVLGEAGGFLGGNLMKFVKLPWNVANDLAKAKGSPPVASWIADSEAGTSVRGPSGELKGQPELPPKNAPPDQVRAIDRQNEAAVALAKFGENVEQLPNTVKNAPNPDLKINGHVADVFSPVTNSPISVLKTIQYKVQKQASTIVVNLQDSAITISQMESALHANPVTGLRAVYIMKNGEITVIKVGQ